MKKSGSEETNGNTNSLQPTDCTKTEIPMQEPTKEKDREKNRQPKKKRFGKE